MKTLESWKKLSLDDILDHHYFTPVMTGIFYLFPLIGLISLLTSDTSYFFGTWLFFRSFGLCYLMAYISLWSQLTVLLCSKGVLPISKTLASTKEEFLSEKPSPVVVVVDKNPSSPPPSIWSLYFHTPTLFWMNSSDLFAHSLAAIGTLSSLFILFDITFIPLPILLFIQYIIYLSFFHVSENFLSLQWDILLLETSYVSFFLSILSTDTFDIPNKIALFGVHFLLYKLMYSSGIVKITSRDPNWKTLNAMKYHYNTQPLPNYISRFIHHLSLRFHQIETLGTFAIEIIAPLMIWISFGGYFMGIFSIKVLCAISFILLNLMISFTGNYGFFNFLYISLCFSLMDDHFFVYKIMDKSDYSSESILFYMGKLVIALAAVSFSLGIAFPCFLRALRANTALYCNKKFLKFFYHIHQFHWCNPYGLFASMTTKRFEIILEGSNDGKQWQEYDFMWKPGDVTRPPVTIPGHMPRVDWAMWFLALRRFPNISPWFIHLMNEVLSGNKVMYKLFRVNPFKEQPPKLLRAVLYEYNLSNPYIKNDSNSNNNNNGVSSNDQTTTSASSTMPEQKEEKKEQQLVDNKGKTVYWDRKYIGLFIPGALKAKTNKP